METITEKMDLRVKNFMEIVENKKEITIPEPTEFVISTQSAMCKIDGIKGEINLPKAIVFIATNILRNLAMGENPSYLIQGLVVNDLSLRFDESHLKKKKIPYIKYKENEIEYNDKESIIGLIDAIRLMESNSIKKKGKQKTKKEKEESKGESDNFYNSCSIIVKASVNIKCVNIKLFNNGRITLTGSKEEMDGYYSTKILLEELKKCDGVFEEGGESPLDNINVANYSITMINTDFHTNFKIDLLKLRAILLEHESNLFVKFNPEKYRGLIIGFFWNGAKKIQDGICSCKIKCKGKGGKNGKGQGFCKKVTISIFKSDSVIITGSNMIEQTDDAYYFVNKLFAKYFHEIVRLSILDFL